MVYIHFALLFACIIYAAKLGGIGVGMARRLRHGYCRLLPRHPAGSHAP